jgi:hypothetical protein
MSVESVSELVLIWRSIHVISDDVVATGVRGVDAIIGKRCVIITREEYIMDAPLWWQN